VTCCPPIRPPAVSGRRIKIRYATQVKARPPHFALFGNQLSDLPKSYTRYLINSMRESFELPGVPIRLSLRTGKNPYDKGDDPSAEAGAGTYAKQVGGTPVGWCSEL
jgi:hypothetical protein